MELLNWLFGWSRPQKKSSLTDYQKELIEKLEVEKTALRELDKNVPLNYPKGGNYKPKEGVVSVKECEALLQGTSARNFCKELLQGTSARNLGR